MVLLAFILSAGVLLGYLGGLVNASNAHPGVSKGRKWGVGIALYALGLPVCFLAAHLIAQWMGGPLIQLVILIFLAFPFWAVAHAIYGLMSRTQPEVAEEAAE